MEERLMKKNEEPQITYRGVKTMPLIIGNETFEKLGTIGTSHNLLVYMTTVFNLSSVTATTLINVFHGTTNFASLPGAFLCDTFFGRYKTLGFASVSSFLGMVILTLTAAIPMLHPPKCTADMSSCVGPTAWQLLFLFASLALLVIGAGGIRPCNLAFGVDQFNPNTESGKRGIDSFFNWYYFTFTFAMMVSLTLIVYVQSELSWTWGLMIPAALMFVSCALFFAGTRIYVKVRAAGSPLVSMARVFTAAFKKRGLKTPERPWESLYNHVPPESYNSKLPYTNQFKFLDKAAIIESKEEINPDGSARDPWRLASMQQVEEMKVVIRVIPIWSSFIIFYLAISMQSTYVVFQALQADRHLKGTEFRVPAGSFSVFSMLSLTLFVPIYDRAIVPALRRLTGKPSGITVLQRMGFGMGLSLVALIMSGLVEDRRRALARLSPIDIDPRRGAISSLSSMWLIPQLTMSGVSEAFTLIAHLEFYYKQFPENMRSIGGSFSFLGMGMSNYLNGFLVSVVHRITAGSAAGDWLAEDLNEARLDLFYYLLAGLGAVNFVIFLMFSRWYKYKESSSDANSGVEMNDLPAEKSIV